MSTQKSFTIHLPTKPYLKKYIETLYGNPDCGTISFSTNNYFGMTVALSLKKPLRIAGRTSVKKMRFDNFNSTLTIRAPRWWLDHYDYHLEVDENQAITVNKLMEAKFEEDLYHFCLNLYLVGIETKDALAAFCKKYNLEIDEDIAFEALKKKEYRFRKFIEKKSGDLSREKTREILKTFIVSTIRAAQ